MKICDNCKHKDVCRFEVDFPDDDILKSLVDEMLNSSIIDNLACADVKEVFKMTIGCKHFEYSLFINPMRNTCCK